MSGLRFKRADCSAIQLSVVIPDGFVHISISETSEGAPVPIDFDQVRSLFEEALRRFLEFEMQEMLEGVNERANCGRMAIYLHDVAREVKLPTQYLVDVEYNRKQEGRVKTILNGHDAVVRVNCDVILHSRGAIVQQDNLIAIEMKKFDRPHEEKISDRERLQALTKDSFDGVWSADGNTLPEHVCGYVLGLFMEIHRVRRTCTVDYFVKGELSEQVVHNF